MDSKVGACGGIVSVTYYPLFYDYSILKFPIQGIIADLKYTILDTQARRDFSISLDQSPSLS